MHLKPHTIEGELGHSTFAIAEDGIALSDQAQPHYLKHIPVPQSPPNILSATVPDISSDSETTSGSSPSPVVTRSTGLLKLNTRQSQASELANMRHLHLRRNLERRLEVARSQGNEELIQLLEAEWEQI